MEFLRAIVGRLREFAADRRWARRLRVRLPLNVSLLETSKANGRRPLPGLEGYTYDIGPTGLAIVVPVIRIGEHYLAGEDRVLLIVLNLPSGPVEIQATPVRYERLEKDESGNYLIGTRIKQMSAGDRTNLITYLDSKLPA